MTLFINNQQIAIQRVRAILLTERGTLMFIKRVKPDAPPYWVAPGGGVEDEDMSLIGTLHRELREELGASIGSMRPVGGVSYEVATIAVAEMINDSGFTVLERNYSGDISRATELPATEIRGVSANSSLGRAVADMSIAEIAAAPLNEFINTLTASGDLSESDIASINRRAPEIHSRALRIANVAGNVRRG